MLIWLYILFLLWETISVFTVNLTKIDHVILNQYWPYLEANVLVSFGSTRPALEAAKRAHSGGTVAERARNVRSSLINLAKIEQAGVINMLSSREDIEFESIWVSNRIYIIWADKALVEEISDFVNVTFIKADGLGMTIDETVRDDKGLALRSSEYHHNVTKGLELIQAPKAWEVLGGARKAGEGVVIGVLGFGAFAGHEALIDNFVGINYGYFDATREPILNAKDVTQGTHVTGTIVGRNGIGVAPAAKHSQCRACTRHYCLESAFEKCIAFFICPTLQDGTQQDCSRRVHVIHLSYSDHLPSMKPIVDAAMSAGIILVAPMGEKKNRTGDCEEGTYPGLFDEVIAVGVVNNADHLHDISPRGPNPNPGGNPKPDVVAPGVDVVSAHYKDPNYKYVTATGSLTATAHVTGVVALLLARDNTLTQDQVRKLIIENVDRSYTNKSECGAGPPNTWPNPEYGYGRINALKALNAQTSMLTGRNRNDSKLENTCQQSFDSYKQSFNEKLRNINSVNIQIRQEIQKSVEMFGRIGHEINIFNATLKKILNKAKQLEKSLIDLEKK